jgi:Mrp family chromosome partitioning ATPase
MPAPVQVPEARKLEPERPEPKAIAGAVDEDASAVAPKDLDVKGAALTLMVDHVERVIVLSPEGDAASVVSVGLARELADRGLRVVLLDLTLSGAATQPMLETLAHKGITDLLTSEAQFSEAIHSDLHSSCHIVPVGTADPSRSTEHIERLPIILGSLSAAYDVVVIECGQTSVKSTAKLAEGKAAVVIGVVDRHDPAVTGIFSELEQEGMKAMVVYSSIEFDRSAVPTDLDAA